MILGERAYLEIVRPSVTKSERVSFLRKPIDGETLRLKIFTQKQKSMIIIVSTSDSFSMRNRHTKNLRKHKKPKLTNFLVEIPTNSVLTPFKCTEPELKDQSHINYQNGLPAIPVNF